MERTRTARPSRRQLLLSGTALLTFGAAASDLLAQENSVDVATRLADLAGTEVLPRDMLSNLLNGLEPEAHTRLARTESLPDALRERILKGLYTGVLAGPDEESAAKRIGFSSALMWAAIDRTNNVISYCGGVPHFWANPPEAA